MFRHNFRKFPLGILNTTVSSGSQNGIEIISGHDRLCTPTKKKERTARWPAASKSKDMFRSWGDQVGGGGRRLQLQKLRCADGGLAIFALTALQSKMMLQNEKRENTRHTRSTSSLSQKVLANNLCILYVTLFGHSIFIKQINVQQWTMVHSWTLIA